jgi:predicted DNA-binding transcriptional regulator YafY
VRALFMLSIPAPLAELGVDQELKAALLKLSAALPLTRRQDEERARQRIHLDWVGWFKTEEPVPHLQTIHRAIWADCRLHLVYHLPFEAKAEWLVDPYGLVAKAGIWYLICARNAHIRVHRVSRVSSARVSEERFERPADFDLASYWRSWCISYEENRPYYPVVARIAPNLVPYLPQHFGDAIHDPLAQAGPPDVEGWITLTLPFETLEAARARILGYGGAVEILEPVALRKAVLDYATQTVTVYGR